MAIIFFQLGKSRGRGRERRVRERGRERSSGGRGSKKTRALGSKRRRDKSPVSLLRASFGHRYRSQVDQEEDSVPCVAAWTSKNGVGKTRARLASTVDQQLQQQSVEGGRKGEEVVILVSLSFSHTLSLFLPSTPTPG